MPWRPRILWQPQDLAIRTRYARNRRLHLDRADLHVSARFPRQAPHRAAALRKSPHSRARPVLDIHHGDRARSCARGAVVSMPSPAVPAFTADSRLLTMTQVDAFEMRYSSGWQLCAGWPLANPFQQKTKMFVMHSLGSLTSPLVASQISTCDSCLPRCEAGKTYQPGASKQCCTSWRVAGFDFAQFAGVLSYVVVRSHLTCVYVVLSPRLCAL